MEKAEEVVKAISEAARVLLDMKLDEVYVKVHGVKATLVRKGYMFQLSLEGDRELVEEVKRRIYE